MQLVLLDGLRVSFDGHTGHKLQLATWPSLKLKTCVKILFQYIAAVQVKDEGYEIAHDGNCITVFSAPNYCDQMGNKGAFITFRGGDMTPHFTQFSAVPHPDVKPMAYASSFMGNMWGF